MFEWPVSGSRSAASKPGLNVRLGPEVTFRIIVSKDAL